MFMLFTVLSCWLPKCVTALLQQYLKRGLTDSSMPTNCSSMW